jgi:hypothetical protein
MVYLLKFEAFWPAVGQKVPHINALQFLGPVGIVPGLAGIAEGLGPEF